MITVSGTSEGTGGETGTRILSEVLSDKVPLTAFAHRTLPFTETGTGTYSEKVPITDTGRKIGTPTSTKLDSSVEESPYTFLSASWI
ncbi:MAG: hypothetical protein GF334_08275 [Candidatus Altiarchaeales archaeon]|nr:hypothetical protein [Candidatus Altiarchaeales archaeon]